VIATKAMMPLKRYCVIFIRSTYCHWHVLRARHFVSVVSCNLSTVSNARQPLITCCEHGDSAVRLETVSIPSDTLLETLDALVSDECFRKEVNCTDFSGELHGVRCFDSINIHGYGVLWAFGRQFDNWS